MVGQTSEVTLAEDAKKPTQLLKGIFIGDEKSYPVLWGISS